MKKENGFAKAGAVGARIIKTIYVDWPVAAYKRGRGK
jgi:hypothetical protein